MAIKFLDPETPDDMRRTLFVALHEALHEIAKVSDCGGHIEIQWNDAPDEVEDVRVVALTHGEWMYLQGNRAARIKAPQVGPAIREN
jgi:hypothetical protein